MYTEENKNQFALQAAKTEATCATEKPAHVSTPENSFFLSFPHFEGKKVARGFLWLVAFLVATFAFCQL